MTTEIEKQFFDTFGIEEIELDYPDNFTYYPEITDRILLELICIANKELIKSRYARGKNTEELKNNILKTFIEDYTFYSKTYLKTYNRLGYNFKHQVQELFKEERCLTT